MKPLCIDLFCGLGGWAEGFLAEGWDIARYYSPQGTVLSSQQCTSHADLELRQPT